MSTLRPDNDGELIDVSDFRNRMINLQAQYKKMNEIDQKELPVAYFDFNRFQDDYSVEDVSFKENEDLVENFIEKEIDRTRARDHEFREHPNKITTFHNFDLSKKPNLDKQKPKLVSLTKFGQVENSSMFSKLESNYLSQMFKSTAQTGVKVDPNEVIIQVGIYHPRNSSKTEEYLVLGSQKLTELRDRIYCLCDHVVKEPRHASYFYIEKTFFNDTRKTDKLLSKEVIEFSKKTKKRRKKSKFQKLQDQKMEDTLFLDLKLVIGKRYLYCHKGCCKHYLIFHEVRMPKENSDNLFRENYPLKIFQNRIKRKKCHICDLFPAKFLTFKSKLSMYNPTFWCNTCYDNFFYDENGKLLDEKDFQVFRYYHD